MDMPKTQPLPDVAHETAAHGRTLDWVGMSHVALPLQWQGRTLAADADVEVNLIDAQARGIHMSRLYLHVQDAFADAEPNAATLGQVLQQLIDSQGKGSDAARLTLRFSPLLSRKALASDNRGWRSYPVTLTAEQGPQGITLRLALTVQYSSTCPASAALSRRANADAFEARFGAQGESVSTQHVSDWLAGADGLAATPHAQRSNAHVEVTLAAGTQSLPIESLLDALEAALATVVQTAVKRADEQAFARLNAQHLMFCEDAARRVAMVLSARTDVVRFSARVEHLESLHAHDAVATVHGSGAARV